MQIPSINKLLSNMTTPPIVRAYIDKLLNIAEFETQYSLNESNNEKFSLL